MRFGFGHSAVWGSPHEPRAGRAAPVSGAGPEVVVGGAEPPNAAGEPGRPGHVESGHEAPWCSYSIEHAELDAAVAASVWAVTGSNGAEVDAVYRAVFAYATEDEQVHWPHIHEE
jgi:hypothetical protein